MSSEKKKIENSSLNKISNYLTIVALIILIPAATVGVYNSFVNSKRIEAMPEDIPMNEKYRLIDILISDSERIDSLILVIDTLKSEQRINEIRLRKALQPRNLIINDTLKVQN